MEETGSLVRQLLNTLPQQGTVTWIGIRPKRKAPLIMLEKVKAMPGSGLEGDHYAGKLESKRQVTLINQEHIQAIASMLGKNQINPGLLRRNIVVKGINLQALKDKYFQIGEAVLEMTGPCHPCSRMEENLGKGGYNAMRGHGGITARVIQGGFIHAGDTVKVIDRAHNTEVKRQETEYRS